MAKALIFLATGYEEVEMLTVVDMLRRAGIDIDMVSVTKEPEVTGSHNITIKADVLFEDGSGTGIDPSGRHSGNTKSQSIYTALRSIKNICKRG